MSRTSRRSQGKRPERRVLVFSEVNTKLRPEQIARALTAARLEAEAARDHSRHDPSPATPEEVSDD
jgi:hypothetical protein